MDGNVYQVKQMAKGTRAPYVGVSILEVQPLTDPPLPKSVFLTADEILFYMGHLDTLPVYALPVDPLLLS